MCLLVPLEPIRVERPPRRQIQNDVDDAYTHINNVGRRLQEVYPPELVEYPKLRRVHGGVERARRRVLAHLRDPAVTAVRD